MENSMENKLEEFREKKEAQFRPKLIEAMEIVDDLMFWMLADKRNLLLAGKLQSATLILESVYRDHFNGENNMSMTSTHPQNVSKKEENLDR